MSSQHTITPAASFALAEFLHGSTLLGMREHYLITDVCTQRAVLDMKYSSLYSQDIDVKGTERILSKYCYPCCSFIFKYCTINWGEFEPFLTFFVNYILKFRLRFDVKYCM